MCACARTNVSTPNSKETANEYTSNVNNAPLQSRSVPRGKVVKNTGAHKPGVERTAHMKQK